ncbi:MAG: aminotransferase class V-fold PLP-dependent enzyme [Gammaproteobacteria bacterium]|nr:aminotransferase class V-fold PLP-dependent enzyme [Gammaproteobacteria bacterium]
MSSAPPLYLDYAATTPVDPAVAGAMAECLGRDGDFGNPASQHAYGARAAQRAARARAQVAALVGAAPEQIIFTSGATESDNLALLGAARASAGPRHLVTLRTEHKAVLDPCRHLERQGCSVTYLTPARSGVLEPAVLAAALRADTLLVSVMYANNETGVLQDIAALGSLCRARGILFHTDCAQAFGKVPLNLASLPVDLASFTAHKLYGPKGIGALYVGEGVRGRALQPVLFGGGQERGLRPGTLPTHQLVGFGAACELAGHLLQEEGPRLTLLRERLWHALAPLGGVHLNGAGAPRVPGILSVSFEGVEGESLLAAVQDRLAVSTGAACNSAVRDASHVLHAMGRSARLAESTLRFSLGRFSSESEVDLAAATVVREVRRLRSMAPGQEPPPAPGVTLVSGEAGGPEQGTWIRFHLIVRGDTVKEARFKALACPHTVDTAAWLCAQLAGRRSADLIPGTPAEWAAARAVPVEKLGRLLIVEDALRDCLTRWH